MNWNWHLQLARIGLRMSNLEGFLKNIALGCGKYMPLQLQRSNGFDIQLPLRQEYW